MFTNMLSNKNLAMAAGNIATGIGFNYAHKAWNRRDGRTETPQQARRRWQSNAFLTIGTTAAGFLMNRKG